MTVGELFALTTGARRFSFDDSKSSLCGAEFWHKYRGTPIWNAEIASVELIPKRDVWITDIVICMIRLKNGELEE